MVLCKFLIEELLAKGIETGTMIAPRPATTSPSVRRHVSKKGRAVDVGEFLVEVESLKVTSKGDLMVALAYINETKKELEITLEYPPKESAFATDDAGNEYTLAKSSGMVRRYKEANHDLRVPTMNVHHHSSFLLCPPGEMARAGFLLRRSSSQDTENDNKKLGTFTISISHYARPTKNFDWKKPKAAFSFSATISNVNPD